MEQVWENISTQVQAYGPKILWAALILLAAFVLGKIVQWAVHNGIKRTGFDDLGPKDASLGKSLGAAAFWIILLIGVVQALTRLEMTQVAEPLNNMVDQIMFYLPKVFGAAIIFIIFALVARIVKQAAAAVFVFADPVPQKMGLTEKPVNISGVLATVLSAIILIIGAIAAFDVLDIAAISEPANELLGSIVAAIPNILIAAIILGIFAFIAKFVSDLIRRTLPSIGIDNAIAELGILKGADKGLTATAIIANVAGFFIVLLGLIQALKALNFELLTDAMNIVLEMGASIVFGAFIIFAGVFLARLVSGAIASTGSGASDTAATIVKWVIIGLSLILGISRMGLDPSGGEFVLNVAEMLAMGVAIGIGGAIAIGAGWGGRDWFGKQLERLSPEKKPSTPRKTPRKTPPSV